MSKPVQLNLTRSASKQDNSIGDRVCVLHGRAVCSLCMACEVEKERVPNRIRSLTTERETYIPEPFNGLAGLQGAIQTA